MCPCVMTHCQALQAKGSTYTWKIENAQQKGFFSMFRLLQTGRNSNNHYYLACSGMTWLTRAGARCV